MPRVRTEAQKIARREKYAADTLVGFLESTHEDLLIAALEYIKEHK